MELRRLIKRYPQDPECQQPDKDLHTLVFLVNRWFIYEGCQVSEFVSELLALNEADHHCFIEGILEELDQYRSGAKVRVP
ncbi:MAG TPA: hypothetical protein VK775_14555 [Chthoniobacterales bacterium]|nr:hypothetical protein [Chthoniobacterales bacterium]